MILTTLGLTALTSFALPAEPATTAPHAALVEGHGKLRWFEGSFEDALAAAKKSGKIVFLDFWAEWCGWCKRLDQDTFSNASVVAEMQDLLCYSIDKDSEVGGRIAAHYGVGGLPTLVFLAPDGSVLDVIVGYRPPDAFLQDVRRIERGERTLPALRRNVAESPDDLFARFDLAIKLQEMRSPDAGREIAAIQDRVASGRGFDPGSVDDQWRLAQKFRDLKDQASYQRHVAAIRKLDPEGRSYPMRLEVFEGVKRTIDQTYAKTQRIDMAPLTQYLAEERDERLLFEGWMLARYLHEHQAQEAQKRGQDDVVREQAAKRRSAEREAWRYCPPELVANLGHDIAWSRYVAADEIAPEELAFAVEVARKAADAAPGSANHLDTLACCLFASGKVDDAVATLERAIALDPANPKLKERLAEFRSGSQG